MRALGGLKTKPDAGSPPARLEPPTYLERAERVCWPLDGPCREVTQLLDYRRALVKLRTRVVNRLRWHLHELDPALPIPPRGLRRSCPPAR